MSVCGGGTQRDHLNTEYLLGPPEDPLKQPDASAPLSQDNQILLIWVRVQIREKKKKKTFNVLQRSCKARDENQWGDKTEWQSQPTWSERWQLRFTYKKNTLRWCRNNNWLAKFYIRSPGIASQMEIKDLHCTSWEAIQWSYMGWKWHKIQSLVYLVLLPYDRSLPDFNYCIPFGILWARNYDLTQTW